MYEAPYKIKIYSSNTKLIADSNSLVTLTNLTSLTDLTSYELYVWKYSYSEIQEGDVKEGAGHAKSELTWSRGQFEFESDEYLMDDINDYFAALKVLRKRNKYIQLTLSPYPDGNSELGTTTQAIAVVITDRSIDPESNKIISLTCQKVQPYV